MSILRLGKRLYQKMRRGWSFTGRHGHPGIVWNRRKERFVTLKSSRFRKEKP